MCKLCGADAGLKSISSIVFMQNAPCMAYLATLVCYSWVLSGLREMGPHGFPWVTSMGLRGSSWVSVAFLLDSVGRMM